MAITNAQQYQQLVNKPANGKRPGYRGSDYGDQAKGTGAYSGGTTGGANFNASNTGGPADDKSSNLQTYNHNIATGQADKNPIGPVQLNDREKALLAFKNKKPKVEIPNFGLSGVLLNLFNKGVNSPIQKFSNFTTAKNRNFFENVIRGGKIPGLSFDSTEEELEEAYSDYMSNRMAGKTDAYGNPTQGFEYGDEGSLTGNFMDNGGGDNNYIPPIIPDNNDDTEEEDVTPTRNLGGLAPRFAGSIFDFDGLADGGRAGAMDGGRMMMMNQEEDDPVGGIMDLETSRQMYGLGKLVKKITRGVKKVAKSPVGKAALMYFGGKALMGGMKGSSLFGKGPGSAFVKMFGANNTMPGFGNVSTAGMGGLFEKLGLVKGYGSMMPTIKGGIALASTLPLLMGQKEEEENNDDYYKTQGINIADIRNNPYKFMAPRFAADGGIMRNGYAEGSEEPVAKKTMPLLDMDGQEMDLREEGGFVPLGRMERADDVPARLSKNEFVFTAEAVRNAGEGDVDKGAEVMYNMMKNLESGGDVSEESQGLEGAREMFQTSQRLEEVI